MIKVAVLAGGDASFLPAVYDLYVGVDGGAKRLLAAGLPLDIAVGDFDSVTAEELVSVRAQAGRFVQAQPEKDDTDLELALLTTFEAYPAAQVTIYGAFGGRLDHSLANVFLPSNSKLAPFMQQLTLVDAQNRLTYLPAGRHELLPQTAMTYVAFLPVQDQELTILGAKYPLTEANYFFKKVYASNEFLDGPITISFDEGYVVVIFSKDGS